MLTAISLNYRAAQASTFRKLFDTGILEWRILLNLATLGPAPGRKIASVIGVDTAAVSRSLKILAERGLVLVERDETHVRRQIVSLTDEGLALYARMEPIAMEREERMLSIFSDGERDLFINLLQRLIIHIPAFVEPVREELQLLPSNEHQRETQGDI
jgi:DNA-binding MarR family transcriptional regulator